MFTISSSEQSNQNLQFVTIKLKDIQKSVESINL